MIAKKVLLTLIVALLIGIALGTIILFLLDNSYFNSLYSTPDNKLIAQNDTVITSPLPDSLRYSTHETGIKSTNLHLLDSVNYYFKSKEVKFIMYDNDTITFYVPNDNKWDYDEIKIIYDLYLKIDSLDKRIRKLESIKIIITKK